MTELDRVEITSLVISMYHGNFLEAIHLGEMSHTQKVTSMWATAICRLMGKTAPIVIKTSLPLCMSFVTACTLSCSFSNVAPKFYCRHFQ